MALAGPGDGYGEPDITASGAPGEAVADEGGEGGNGVGEGGEGDGTEGVAGDGSVGEEGDGVGEEGDGDGTESEGAVGLKIQSIVPFASSLNTIDLNDTSVPSTANWSYNSSTNTYTIISGPVTVIGTASAQTAVNIASGAIVSWQATLSGTLNATASAPAYILTLTGSGTLNIDSGGSIENDGTGGAISITGCTLNVNSGGTVNSPGSGIAIFNGGASSAITVNSGGTVLAGNSSAISSNSRDTVVSVTGGTVTNAAISNINPTINMTYTPAAGDPALVNILVSGGLVQTTNPSSTSYVIQTTQNVTISGSAEVTALAGRAINLVGPNSIATVNAGATVSAVSGIAISTATTNAGTVPNAQIIVNGGYVYTGTGTAAIQTTGTSGKVTVTGGQVTATSGVAIKATGNVTISGGFVFAYGTVMGQVVSAPNTNFPTSGGVVAAWNNATLNPLYMEGAAGDLVILPANPAALPNNVYWHNNGSLNGIQYSSGADDFFQLPVTVTTLAFGGPQGLIFDIASGMFYIGSVTGTIYGDQATNWSWASGTLTLDGFSWATTAPVALTIVGGSAINIDLVGSNTFVSTGAGTGAAGILSGASITVVPDSTGALNATASAGIGIDCGANSLTMQGGTVNAAAGNGTNAHGLNVGTLTISGGALNASSGGPATTGAFYGINAAKLVVTDGGDGVVTASGNSRAINNAALTLPNGYQYSKGTKPDGSNAGTFFFPGAAAYVYSANNSYVQIKALMPCMLTVVNGVIGSGPNVTGTFYPGQTVTVTSAIVPSATNSTLVLGPSYPTQGSPTNTTTYPLSISVFKDWTSAAVSPGVDNGSFASPNSGSTSFTMPGNDVTVTAESQTAYKLWTDGARIKDPLNPTVQTDWEVGYYLPGTEVLLGLNSTSSYNGNSIFAGWTDSSRDSGGASIPGSGVFSNTMSTTTTYTMPTINANVVAPWTSISTPYVTAYTLTVIGGTGATFTIPAAGTVPGIMAGTWVNLTATGTPPVGQEFACWQITTPATPPGYQGAFININSATTQFIMGEGNITVTATYKPIKYTLTVKKGTDETGAGQYAPGDIIKIKADAPQPMYEFTRWVTEYVMVLALAADDGFDHEASEAFFVMPPGHTTVTADYTKVYFELTVLEGLGSGEYKNGDLVVVTASAPPGKVFDHWVVVSGGAKIKGAMKADAVVTMPGRDATIRAIFRTAGSPGPGSGLDGEDAAYRAGVAGAAEDSPGTGDSNNIEGWTASMASSAAGLLGILFWNVRRKQLL